MPFLVLFPIRRENMLSPAETIKAYSEAGVKKLNRPVPRMFILAIFAGIFIALPGI